MTRRLTPTFPVATTCRVCGVAYEARVYKFQLNRFGSVDGPVGTCSQPCRITNIRKFDPDYAEEPAPMPLEQEGWVYFIQDGPHLKIGYTARGVKYRLRPYRTHNPRNFRLVAAVRASKDVETAYHKQFEEHRVPDRKEWFFTDAVLPHIAHLTGADVA